MDRELVVEDEIFLHLEDEQRTGKGIFEMDIELIEIIAEPVQTERLGEHEALLDTESGSLLLDNGKHQLVLPVQEAYMLLEFLYQHRDSLDAIMHAIVE